MKVSIITISFNSEETIKDTIESVLGQSYTNIEYIVVDAASKDYTVKIIEDYREQIAHFISEPDEGIYYGMNKGIKLATGDVVGILNSDDVFNDANVIQDVIDSMKANSTDAVYGDLVYVDRHDLNIVKRYWKSGKYETGSFMKGWMPPHPAFFLKLEHYHNYGAFQTDLRTSADYELMLRMLHKHNLSASYLPRVITRMRMGGQSNASVSNRVEANREDRMAWEINGLKPGKLTFIRKPLSKLSQFIKKGAN